MLQSQYTRLMSCIFLVGALNSHTTRTFLFLAFMGIIGTILSVISIIKERREFRQHEIDVYLMECKNARENKKANKNRTKT